MFVTSSFGVSLQFVTAVALLVTASITHLLFRNTSLEVHQPGAASDTDGKKNDGIPIGRYMLKPRLILWIRQILLCTYFFVALYAFLNTPVAEDEKDQKAWLNRSGWFFISNLSYLLAIAVIIYLDNIGNLCNVSALKAWLAAYTMLLLHAVISYAFSNTITTCILLVLSALVLVAASVCAFVDLSIPQINPPTFEYTCGLFDTLSFSHINKVLIIPGMKKVSFEFDDDVPGLSDLDSSHEVWKRFRKILLSTKELNLWYSLYELVKWEWFAQGFFQFMGSTATYITPLALERILLHVASHGNDEADVKTLVPISVSLAVVLLFVGPVLSCIGDNQNYVRGRYRTCIFSFGFLLSSLRPYGYLLDFLYVFSDTSAFA